MAKVIIGRDEEQKTLKDALNSHRSELVAVYGRRRIGKTHLVREYYEKETILKVTGSSSPNRDVQIKNVMTTLLNYTDKFKDEKPVDWIDTFAILRKFIENNKKNGKKVIFLDEIPWMDTKQSGFLPAFEHFWNDYCNTRDDLVVVICGSAASYMVKKLIKNPKGLSKRITQAIKLQPFTLGETRSFFLHKQIDLTEYDILKLYMVMGGVAEYLEQVKRGESVVSTIQRLCFKKDCYFEEEFDDVFESLFNTSSFHKGIIDALADSKKEGVSRADLLTKCGKNSSRRFSDSLKELERSGFVLMYDSYKGNKKTKLYRITDEFCLFHLQFMVPFKGSNWQNLYKKSEYVLWCGYAFETICLKHVDQIKNELGIPTMPSKNYTWSNANAQVDLVIDRDDNAANLCELKFKTSPFIIDQGQMKGLQKKELEFNKDRGGRRKNGKNIFTSFITTEGITNNKWSKQVVDHDYGVDCLFH